jgi:large subunit ribosomal protein L32e
MKFIRQDGHKKAKLKRSSWRKPKGLQNKMRLQKKGYRRLPKVGMGTPGAEKNTLNGKEIIRISSVEQLVNAKGKIAILSSVGMKKKIIILEEAIKQNIEFNFDVKKVLEGFNKEISERKKASEEYKKEREAKQVKRAKEEKKAKEEVEEEKSDEEKKKDLDKELIHRK